MFETLKIWIFAPNFNFLFLNQLEFRAKIMHCSYTFKLLKIRIFAPKTYKSVSFTEFSMVESAPATHKFKLSVFQPNDPKNFIKFVRKEVKLLRTSLPSGIHVKGFEDRMVNFEFSCQNISIGEFEFSRRILIWNS